MAWLTKLNNAKTVAITLIVTLTAICVLTSVKRTEIRIMPHYLHVKLFSEAKRRNVLVSHTCNHYFDGLELVTTGRFTERIGQFNVALESIRRQILQQRGLNESWRNELDPKNITLVHSLQDGFMNQLRVCPRITTVVLPWQNETTGPRTKPWSSLTDTSNLLRQAYPKWTADDKLCNWTETPGLLLYKDGLYFNYTCNRNINDTLKLTSILPTLLYSQSAATGPIRVYADPPSFVTYMFIHTNAIVMAWGEVFSQNCKLVLLSGCRSDMSKSLPGNIDKLPIYDEIFVISQDNGKSIFHRMAEAMPRVALHLEFLRSNPQIRIAALEGNGGRLGELLRVLDIDPLRLVTGIVRAKVVYLPRHASCGYPNVLESQVLNRLYLEYIDRSFPARPRNGLVVIRRSGGRKFSEQKAIEEIAKRLAREHSLNFTVFHDQLTPSLNDTMRMFHSAAIVIGPTGAGLTNLLFSQPGTFVIEGVCNLPFVSYFLHRIVYIIGHHWHGVTSRGGCEGVVDVAPAELESALRAYIRLWEQEQN